MAGHVVSGRSPYWHGMLCAETRDEIVSRMDEVLGGRWFSVVQANSYSEESERFSAVDVASSQFLTAPIKDYNDSAVVGISWSTPRWSMGVHNRARTQAEARDGGPHQYVHFTFEPGKVVIDHYAPARYRLQWIFAVECRDTEMAGAPEAAA